ncbi:MAG: class I SAM-dependent methyltransferase [Anaerolineaceae bacterium]
MLEHETIYSRQADLYERLILKEDYQENLPRELKKITSECNLDVVELGAGTGRLTRWLAMYANRITALDLSSHMLAKAASILWPAHRPTVTLAAGDHLHLPVPSSTADLVIAGWSVCYLVSWHPNEWQPLLMQSLDEMKRVLHPRGKIILVETLGTGAETPNPPEKLIPYYQYLEAAGFQSTWLRTDYRFESMNEAEEITRFFFGDEMLPKIQKLSHPILPECTGIWCWR